MVFTNKYIEVYDYRNLSKPPTKKIDYFIDLEDKGNHLVHISFKEQEQSDNKQVKFWISMIGSVGQYTENDVDVRVLKFSHEVDP